MGDEDEKDARAFRDDAFMDLIERVDAMPPPTFHAAISRGPRRGATLCGAVGYTRGALTVTCEACKRRLARRRRAS